MAKLPEDLRTALETLGMLNEKVIVPLSRLPQVLRTCVEHYGRMEDANEKLKKLQDAIDHEEQKATQKEERFQERLKVLSEQLDTLQAKYVHEEHEQDQKRIAAQQVLAQLGTECATRREERDALIQEIQEESQRLEGLRERIRRAQTMEP